MTDSSRHIDLQPPHQTEAAHRLAAIVESSCDAIVSKDLNGIIQTWNAGAERIFGFSANEVIGQPITLVIPPELQKEKPAILARIANGERIDGFETVRRRKDGTTFPISLTIPPIRDETGVIIGASKIGRDITDVRESIDRYELLLREMNHRVKNLFAIASGVIALSARSAETPKELAISVQSRLAALSRAHELILPRGDKAAKVGLAELVGLVLAPYREMGQQLQIFGPLIECGNVASTSLALLFHEFATNSVKYGALSDPEGQVSVSWEENESLLTMIWAEQTRLPRPEKTVAGFGNVLVEATARSLGAELNRAWKDDGLMISLLIPSNRVSL